MALTVVYDQDCGVCTAVIDWFRSRDPALKAIGNREALPEGVPQELAFETVIVLDSTGRRWTHAEAMSRLLRQLPGSRSIGFRVLGLLISLPLVKYFARRGYIAFAHRRHRVSAALGLGVCGLPPRPQKHRFPPHAT